MSKCLFTDESEFETISGRKYKRVRRREDEDKYQDKYIQRVVKHPATFGQVFVQESLGTSSSCHKIQE